jgi:RNA-directed DNA polymerase
MKRVGRLWGALVSFGNLHEAARRAALGKRNHPDVATFLLNLELELTELHSELKSGAYSPGPYREFLVSDGKRRHIAAAPFRDRVVHHALTQVLEPVFERRFTKDSFACRLGMGTHKALDRAKWGVRNFPYVLKCDVRKYFASVDHGILKDLLSRVIKCRPTLELAGRVIDGFDRKDEAVYFEGDDLFTPFQRTRGLPLGNQTSQFFANVYLNPLDHFVTEVLGPGAYVRYVDDFILFAHSKETLRGMKDSIEEHLERVRLRIHEGKGRVYRCQDGVTFLGFRLFPDRTRLVRSNVVRFRRRLRGLHQAFLKGSVGPEDLLAGIRAWIAHAAHANTWELRRRVLSRFRFPARVEARRIGSAAGSARGLLEQQSSEAARIEPQQEPAR